MAVNYTKPRGTQDVLPSDSYKWQKIEKDMHRITALFNYGEIRLPTFESTDVFARGVGDTTDIVGKEMYTFDDKGGRSMTLRPEGTAGVARAVLENGLLNSMPMPLKMYYIQSCFRYEKSQKGRLREFHQLGLECFGSQDADADIEIISVGDALLKNFGVRDCTKLEINSIGCPECRKKYNEALKAYFESSRDKLCETCIERLSKNPMRILDCKSEVCSKIANDAPQILDYICEDCSSHFENVKSRLDDANISYIINPRIVRGLDYYTRTVFEFIANGIGTQGTVCAGGRYDGLISTFGGQQTPAVGFGLGMERLIMLIEQENPGYFESINIKPALYAVGIGDEGRKKAKELVKILREASIPAEHDISNRSVKAQMKAGDRSGATFTTVIGEDEALNKKAQLKCMANGEIREINLENIAEEIKEALVSYGISLKI